MPTPCCGLAGGALHCESRPMDYLFKPPAPVSVPINGESRAFAVHRIYCVGRNYEDHAKEMGFTGREPPFFFLKPADSLVVVPLSLIHISEPTRH